MGLLDGGLKSVFGNAFGPIFLPAIIHRSTRVDDGAGRGSLTWADSACKAIIVDLTEAQREEAGSEEQVSIIILQSTAGGVVLDTDCHVTAKRPGSTVSTRCSIMAPAIQDPAGATWTVRGLPLDAEAIAALDRGDYLGGRYL